MGLFFEKHLRDLYVIYTSGLLIGAVLLETYQLLKLFSSDWVIIKNSKHHRIPLVLKFLKFLVERSLKKERWSNKIRQFNFVDFCLSNKRHWPFEILKLFGTGGKFMRYWATSSVSIPEYLKVLLLEDMKKFEEKRDHQRFSKRGEWTLNSHESLDKLKWSIRMQFDKSIIIWHIATDICNKPCPQGSNHKKASKLTSDYMMFLLVQHPQILSLTMAKITFHHAYSKFKTFLQQITEEPRNKENVLKNLPGLNSGEENDPLEIVITKGWNVLEKAQRLARELERTEDTWKLVSSVWVEMLCFAAYNCQQYQHAKLLRQGGEIITHMWLLLSHKTDKFDIMKYMERDIDIEKR